MTPAAVDGDLLAFRPNAARAAALDRLVRGAFADSMATVLRSFADQGALAPEAAGAAVRAVRTGAAPPAAVAAYADLVEAVYGDDHAAADDALRALIEATDRAPWRGTRCVTLCDAALGRGQAARYRRLFDDDPGSPLDFAAAPPEELARATRLAADAAALLGAADADLLGEVRALVREIVFVSGRRTPEGFVFNGVSSFYVWGAVLMNAGEQRSRLDMVQSLVHESGHGLLFGLSRGAPLVENPPAERYPSPLRDDPRPMDGLVHAAYVCARMELSLRRLLAAGVLDADERALAAAAAEGHRRGWEQGCVPILAHARFTDVGRAAFAAARDCMAAGGG
ncbi:MAG: hypothetical protein IT561_23425 [Alphaproteobacteria bacterium]|nr:hypothetical protein [Alphaproteobacteria bacterium]